MNLQYASHRRVKSMSSTSPCVSRPRFRCSHIAALILCCSLLPSVSAEEAGHDHGDEAAATHTDASSPRFSTHSEAYELVGVLDEKVLTLYLDRADTNAPVEKARLELEIGGAVAPVTETAPGEYRATLNAPLKPGITPITATIVAQGNSDLLAGEIDIHEDADNQAPMIRRSRTITLLAWAGGFAGIVAAGWWIRRRFGRKRSNEGTEQ